MIYASSDDRCAHIVLSIWAEMAQGRWAVRIQSPVRLHPPAKSGSVAADAVGTAEALAATSCCHGQEKKKFKVRIHLSLRWKGYGGVSWEGEVSGKYQVGIQSSTPGHP